MAVKKTMTREEMLARMNLSERDFTGYVQKYTGFLNSLSPSQKAFHTRNNPGMTVPEIARTLGPDVNPEHIHTLLAELPATGDVSPINCCHGGQPVGARGNLG